MNILDFQLDDDFEFYFQYPEELRDKLAADIVQQLLKGVRNHRDFIPAYIISTEELIDTLRQDEQYEKCELMRRIQKNLISRLD